MKTRQASITFLAVTLLFLAGIAPARAQDAPTIIDPAQVPAAGARAEDFVPRGWKIGGRAEGDLNGDGRADSVLQLVPEDTPDNRSINDNAPLGNALVILLASDNGRFRRAGVAPRLLATPFTFIAAQGQYSLELTIRNGILIVHQLYGMTDAVDLTHLFRYDPATARFLLIGKQTWNYHRPQGPDWPSTRVSENYLTGVRLTTTERWLNNETQKATTRRAPIARARVFIEDVDEDPDR